MKRALMIATGGTITPKRDVSELEPLITSREILSYIPDTRGFCRTDTLQLFSIDSTNIQPMHWLAMANAIEGRYMEYDDFVIYHGTDAVTYTATALPCLIQSSRKPIVITGAQKPIDMEITDTKINPSDSLLFVSHGSTYGTSIVSDGKVIAGTRGRRERTKSYNAFSSISFPYIASVQSSRVIFYLDDKNQLDESVTFCHKLNLNVALLKLIPSMDATMLDYMAGRYDAIITKFFGVSGLLSCETGAYHPVIKRWIFLGRTVIMTTQVTNEGNNMSAYEVDHSIEQEFGLLETYDMTLKATVTKLMWVLGQAKDAANVRQLFYTTINRDILWG